MTDIVDEGAVDGLGAHLLDDDGSLAAGDVLDRVGTWLFRVVPRLEWNTVALGTLALVCRRGPLRLGDLVAAEDLSQPGMTNLVSRLEAAGLLERRDDPTDGRAILVTATEAGQAYLAEVHRRRADHVARHVRDLGEEERAALAAALPALERLTRMVPPPGSAEGR